MKVDRYKVHNIEIVVDRLLVRPEGRGRIADSVEAALRFGGGVVLLSTDGAEPTPVKRRPGSRTNSTPRRKKAQGPERDLLFSSHLACPECSISYEEPAPNSFSFNSPYGACPVCNGLGEVKEFDLALIIPDDSLSVSQGGIAPLGKPRSTWAFSQVRAVGKRYGFDFDTPLRKAFPTGP